MQENLVASTDEYAVKGNIWLEHLTDSERFLGKGRIQLLTLIAAHGSIAQAAKTMNMSYKRAWDLVSSMNAQAVEPLVITQVGGKRGGGTVVTAAGHRALAYYEALQERFQAFLAQETQHFRTYRSQSI